MPVAECSDSNDELDDFPSELSDSESVCFGEFVRDDEKEHCFQATKQEEHCRLRSVREGKVGRTSSTSNLKSKKWMNKQEGIYDVVVDSTF